MKKNLLFRIYAYFCLRQSNYLDGGIKSKTKTLAGVRVQVPRLPFATQELDCQRPAILFNQKDFL